MLIANSVLYVGVTVNTKTHKKEKHGLLNCYSFLRDVPKNINTISLNTKRMQYSNVTVECSHETTGSNTTLHGKKYNFKYKEIHQNFTKDVLHMV